MMTTSRLPRDRFVFTWFFVLALAFFFFGWLPAPIVGGCALVAAAEIFFKHVI